jgi:PTS system galactitol-specific IIA component
MNFSAMFEPHLIDLQVTARTEIEFFQIVAEQLKAIGLVNDGYLEGLIEREKAYPTGLMTQYLNIALPHSEPEFVARPFVFICRLEQAITCYQMGDNQEMAVKDLFFLGIKDGKKQVGLLQALMTLFMDKNFVDNYRSLTCPERLCQLFTEQI